MQVTSSYLKIKTKRDDSTELPRFFMRSNNLFYINNDVEFNRFEKYSYYWNISIGFSMFISLSENLWTNHSYNKADTCKVRNKYF